MDLAIRNNGQPPAELIEHLYRKTFHLSYRQLIQEPAYKMAEGIMIEQLLKEFQQDEIKAAERNSNG